jgi:hypothetical protein
VVVRQPDRVAKERIEAGRFENRIAVATEIAVTLVVGKDEDDVGTLPRRFDGSRGVLVG